MDTEEFMMLLKTAGLSKKGLARLLGKDTSTVSRWGAEGPHGLPIPRYAQVALHTINKLHPDERRILLARFA